jgi:hypothetical protein
LANPKRDFQFDSGYANYKKNKKVTFSCLSSFITSKVAKPEPPSVLARLHIT